MIAIPRLPTSSSCLIISKVYVTILAALPSVCVGLRSSINQNLTEIVKLHEELLGELHRVVPHSEYTQADLAPSLSTLPNADCLHTHRRWSSLDAIPEQNVKARWLLKAPGMLSDPQVAAEVSKVFAKKVFVDHNFPMHSGRLSDTPRRVHRSVGSSCTKNTEPHTR